VKIPLHKIVLVFALLLFGVQNATAQTSFPLSMVTTAPKQLNPALTGLTDSRFRAHLSFKSQIGRELTGGISGTGISVDYNFADRQMGLGLSVFSNSLNRTALRDFNLMVSYSYRLLLNDWSLLSFGVQSGFAQVGFDIDALRFGSQFDPSHQGGFDPNAPRPFELQSGNKNNIDASVGVHWQALLGTSVLLTTGVSAFHLIPVRMDFLREDTYLRPKYVMMFELRYVGEPFHFIPSVLHVTQSGQRYTEWGGRVEFRDRTNFASVGVFHRTPNVIIPAIGFGIDRFALNLSIEYYLRANFSQIFNISLVFRP